MVLLFGNNPCYRPKTKLRKVMFLHLSVSHSVHKGVVYTPQEDTPNPQADTPPPRWPLNRAVRILLECILVTYCSVD